MSQQASYFILIGNDEDRILAGDWPLEVDPDPLVTLAQDVYMRESYGVNDPGEGTKVTLFARTGSTFRQSALTVLQPLPEATSVAPAAGPLAEGDTVTITGRDLTDVTEVYIQIDGDWSSCEELSRSKAQIVVAAPNALADGDTVRVRLNCFNGRAVFPPEAPSAPQ